jgi:hypothetical protein
MFTNRTAQTTSALQRVRSVKAARAVMVAAAAGALAASLAGPASAQATAPAAASLPRVTSVVFTGASGGTTAPTITVTGTGFGARPPGQPDHACGGTFTGDYYGPNFYFWDDTPYWESGLIGDCIGITVSSWTTHQIVFSFGSAYGTQPSYTMRNGDNYALKIRSLLQGGTVNGLS